MASQLAGRVSGYSFSLKCSAGFYASRGFPDITQELARESGFLGVLDLLKVAKHGRGENLIQFHYVRPHAKRKAQRKSRAR